MDDLLASGIAAAQQGDLARAGELLSEAVRSNPDSEQGWLWLARCLPDPERQAYCFHRALALNPHCHEALEAQGAPVLGGLLAAARPPAAGCKRKL